MHLEKQIPGTAVRRVPPTQEAKTARWLLFLIPTTLLLLAVSIRVVVTSDAFTREVTAYIAGQVANRTHAAVQLSGVTFGYDFAPCFHDFEIYRISGAYKLKATTREACVERWASAVGSGFHAIRLRLSRPSIVLEGSRGTGERAFEDVRPRALTGTTTEGHRSALREVQVVFDDLRLDWDGMPLPERVSSGSFGPIDGMVTLQLRNGRSAATFMIREPTTGSTINGRVNPTDDGLDLSAGLEGDMVPIFWKLFEGSPLDIRKMPTRGRIGAIYSTRRRAATVDVDLEQTDLDVANELVSKTRLVGFSAREKARIEADFGQALLELKDGVVEINGVPVTLSLNLRPGTNSPAFDVRATLPTTPLLRLLRSVPDAREPEFAKALSPSVLFALAFSMTGELREPSSWQPKLDEKITGIGPKGAGSGLEYLHGNFRFYPLTRDGRSDKSRLIGPESSSWMPFSRIPYIQKRAVVVSEDSSFYVHHGVDITEIQDAIRKGMTTGGPTRGGSTLTQQLVKNLFLTRDRTALRKLQELLMTFHVEASLSKDQIFELYLNLIEWGRDVYGIKEASLHYFGKHPDQLTIREICWLTANIPSPANAEKQYEAGYAFGKLSARVDGLLERLNKLGTITDAQYEEAKQAKVHFVHRSRDTKERQP